MTDPTLQDTTPDPTSRILALAETVMGDRNRALSWLTSPKRSLGNETPINPLKRGHAMQIVRELLHRVNK